MEILISPTLHRKVTEIEAIVIVRKWIPCPWNHLDLNLQARPKTVQEMYLSKEVDLETIRVIEDQ